MIGNGAMKFMAGGAAGLRDVHLRMLERAKDHPEGLLTPPANLPPEGHARLAREIVALGAAEFVRGVSFRDEDLWAFEEGARLLRITDRGLAALGDTRPGSFEGAMSTTPASRAGEHLSTDAKAAGETVSTRRASRRSAGQRAARRDGTRGEATRRVLELLRRADGASLDEIAVEVGWRRHTVRGFLAQLRKRGFAIQAEVDSCSARHRPAKRYRLSEESRGDGPARERSRPEGAEDRQGL